MHSIESDTICALATAPGRSGIGIVRISGPAVSTIARKILGLLPAPRKAHFNKFLDSQGQAIDQGIALYFPAPASFTGEDVLELQGHGGIQTLTLVIKTALDAGARLARPGEFSERAFLNDKLDLVQLEAIADIIDAGSETAARSAYRTFNGTFSRSVAELVDGITDLRVYIEAAIDFSEEEIDFLAGGKIQEKLSELSSQLQQLFRQARQGALLREGLHLVIAGKPNAGKSSLLNQLSGQETAIVTEIPGTTRDLLRETINLDGLPLHLIDTAGLRNSDDPVEQEGVRRARETFPAADQILLLIDAQEQTITSESIQPALDLLGLKSNGEDLGKIILVVNKIDLLDNHNPGVTEIALNGSKLPVVFISAKTGSGMNELRELLKQKAGYQLPGEGSFIARQRHLEALARASEFLRQAANQLLQNTGSELVAEDLRLAQKALGEITGEVTSDDLLGKIFSSFCVGK